MPLSSPKRPFPNTLHAFDKPLLCPPFSFLFHPSSLPLSFPFRSILSSALLFASSYRAPEGPTSGSASSPGTCIRSGATRPGDQSLLQRSAFGVCGTVQSFCFLSTAALMWPESDCMNYYNSHSVTIANTAIITTMQSLLPPPSPTCSPTLKSLPNTADTALHGIHKEHCVAALMDVWSR